MGERNNKKSKKNHLTKFITKNVCEKVKNIYTKKWPRE